MIRTRPREPWGDRFLVMRGVGITRGEATLLDHVDLDVKEGELLALVGANGAGKSSLLRCMAGLWKPDEGRIRIEGQDRFLHDLAIRRFTAYLPSEPELLSLTVRENLGLFAEAWGVDEDDYHERQDALLRMFDLRDKQDTPGTRLSKGELKKACLAGVLLTGARLYLLDEPFTGGIDPRGYHALMRVMDTLAGNRRITVVFATQILELAEHLADRIAVVNFGRVLAVGTKEELRRHSGLEDDAPFEEVFARLASRDTEVPMERFLATLDGTSRDRGTSK